MSHHDQTSSKTVWRGAGVGLRPVHYAQVLRERPDVAWFEVITENFIGMGERSGGRPVEILERVRADYPVALHGVSLNVGSVDPLSTSYLGRLRELVRRMEPVMVSDHLCWTGVEGKNLHDLLPLPYTEEAVRHVSERVARAQELIGRRIALENVSSYLAYQHSEMTEWEFITEVARRADCELLVDVNNIVVSAHNQGFSATAYLEGLPEERVRQMHLAGYSEAEGMFIDTHDAPVAPSVWELFETAVRRFGPVPVLIEWDARIPSFARLEEEARHASRIQEVALGARPPVLANAA